MKKIEIFLPSTVDPEVFEEHLFDAGAVSISLCEVKIFNKDSRKIEKYRGVERIVRNSARIKAEIIAAPDSLIPVVQAINACLRLDETVYCPAFVTEIASPEVTSYSH